MTTAEYKQWVAALGRTPTSAEVTTETLRRAGVKSTPKTAIVAPKGIGQITKFTGAEGYVRPPAPEWVKAVREGIAQTGRTLATVATGGAYGMGGITEAEAATPQKPPPPVGGTPIEKKIASPKITSKVAGIGQYDTSKALPFLGPFPPLPEGSEEYNKYLAAQIPEPTSIATLPATAAATTPAPEPSLWEKAKGKVAGIGEGIGTWASDPKIARALMTAGLTTLATEPRRVPYSNAEMLGRAGIAGIGAYDTEVAKETAAKETARKAGLESLKETREATASTISNEYYKAKTNAEKAGLETANTPMPESLAKKLGLKIGATYAEGKEAVGIIDKVKQAGGRTENVPDIIQIAEYMANTKAAPDRKAALNILLSRKEGTDKEYRMKLITTLSATLSPEKAVAEADRIMELTSGEGSEYTQYNK